MKRVLITGANGFIGRHCLPLLEAQAFEVHAISSRKMTAKGSNIYWHEIDLLDFSKTEALIGEVQPGYLLHFAWYTVPGRYWTSTENLRWLQGSIGLIQEFIRHGGKRMVIAGTCAEYDWRYGYCSETMTPLAPTTLYGLCKHALQLIVTDVSKQTGVSAAWGRIFFVFGPHEPQDRLVAYVIRSLLHGEAACCSHGRQIRDFLYVRDVADAFVTLLESGVSGPLNIGSGQPIFLRELIYGIAAKLNRNDLIQLDARAMTREEPPLLVPDVRRLYHEVGWRPKYSLEKALEHTISWWERESRG